MCDPDDADLHSLREANPVRMDQVPGRSLARVQASAFDEVNKTSGSRSWRQRGISVSLAGVAAAVVVVGVLSQGPSATGVPAAGGSAIAAGSSFDGAGMSSSGAAASAASGTAAVGGNASCAQVYSLEALGERGWAYDATVTGVVGDQVTFRVDEAFRGSAVGSVSLSAVGQGGSDPTSEGGPAFVVGQRYLISGEDKSVWGCGFSREYDAATASDWRRVLGS